MAIYSGVSGIISAAHKGLDGRLHGHTWEVIAWWRNDAHMVDADSRKIELDRFLAFFDHSELCHELLWGELLAEHIGTHLKCEIVEIRRQLERIYARWERSE